MPDRRFDIQQQRRRRAGRASLNTAFAALGITCLGYLLGFVVPSLVNSSTRHGMGSVMFLPIGGFASLFLAIMAIRGAGRVRRFTDGLSEFQRERISSSVDLRRQRTLSVHATVIATICIVANPLIAFAVVTLVRRA
jgi:hypothetical protein